MIETNRRSLLLGAGASITAPAIVRASSLMAIKVPKPILMWVGYDWHRVGWDECKRRLEHPGSPH